VCWGEASLTPEKSGETLYENDGVRLWALPAVDGKIGIIPSSRKCTPSATRCWMA
jgi:3-hydroxyacyl-CoA dehydrogenase